MTVKLTIKIQGTKTLELTPEQAQDLRNELNALLGPKPIPPPYLPPTNPDYPWWGVTYTGSKLLVDFE